MALVSKLPSLSSSSPKFRKPNSFKLNPVRSIHCTSNSPSPFTEKHSIERYNRDNWVYKSQLEQPDSCPGAPDPGSIRDHEIAAQLPELKRLLEVLREKRESTGGGERGRGPGNVFLVGTGPGDPELLTVKAVRVIRCADLLLYDRLVSNEVLDLVGPDARLLYVGKTAGYHSRTQVRICFYGYLFVCKFKICYYFQFADMFLMNLDGGFGSFMSLDSDFVVVFWEVYIGFIFFASVIWFGDFSSNQSLMEGEIKKLESYLEN